MKKDVKEVDEREKTVLKVSLEMLLSDLRVLLKEFGQEPKDNALFPESEFKDLSASHQQFYDPQHCDGGLGADQRKGVWVDANQSDYPLKVAKAYWNSAQTLKALLEVEKSWSLVSVFAAQFAESQKTMNACFDFLDDTKLPAGEIYRTQAPQVVDQRSLRLAKLYKKFADTMMMDADPLLALRLSAQQFSGGSAAAGTINKYKDQFQRQFMITSEILAQRIGIYEARLNENIRIDESQAVVSRVEKLRHTLRVMTTEPQKFCESAEQAVSEVREFLQSPDYANMNNAQQRVVALEERLQRLENIVDINVQQSIAAIDQQEDALDSTYSISTKDPNYVDVVMSGQDLAKAVKLLEESDKKALKIEYKDAIQTLEGLKKPVEQKRAELNECKTELRRELSAQRALAKKETMPTGPSVGLSGPDIYKKNSEDLGESREVLREITEEFKKQYPMKKSNDALNSLVEGLDNYIDYKRNSEELARVIEDERAYVLLLKDLLVDLKAEKLPLDAKRFEKLKKAMQWDEVAEKSWQYLKEKQGMMGWIGVSVRLTTDPLVAITEAVEKNLRVVERQLEEHENEMGWIDRRSEEYKNEFARVVEEVGVLVSELIIQNTESLVLVEQDPTLATPFFEMAKDLQALAEQVFGPNETHQELFADFSAQYEALPKANIIEEKDQQPLEDPHPEQRNQLYDRYFGQKGIANTYLSQRSNVKLYSVKDAIQKKISGRSDLTERQEYMDFVKEKLNQYQQTGDIKLLVELQADIQLKLRDEKEFSPRVSALIQSKVTDKKLNLNTMKGVLQNVEDDIKVEMSRRAKVAEEKIGLKSGPSMSGSKVEK